jgi:hypothetical protein
MRSRRASACRCARCSACRKPAASSAWSRSRPRALRRAAACRCGFPNCARRRSGRTALRPPPSRCPRTRRAYW